MRLEQINSQVPAASDYHQRYHPMIKNLTSSQLLLIAIAAVLLLLAAFSFYLLQDPSAPLPFAPPPGTSSSTPLPPPPTVTPVPTVLQPTRQTSYTPLAAFVTPNTGTASESPTQSGTSLSSETASPTSSTLTPTSRPPGTPSSTVVPSSATSTTSPTATGTLSPGEYGVTGRVVQNGTAVANVVVEFADDVAPRQATTNPSGHYWFITFAPGVNFTLTFKQSDNLRLTPTPQVASLAWIEGTMPTGVNIIDLPDLEVSINLNGIAFELLSPADGSTYSASSISTSNPIQFNWSLYSQGGTYMVQLGPNSSDVPIWSSSQLSSTSYMWNGTLNDGTHISQGSYWWRVSVTKSLGNYILVVFTQQFHIQFNP
jgi:hypothetical protein